MRVGNFSLLVPEGRECDSGHIELAHGSVYCIKLMNHCYSKRCDALVTVDGREVGFFRLDKGGNLVLERPTNDRGRFTFFRADSQEAQEAGLADVSVNMRGLIQVIFKPEKYYTPPPQKVSQVSSGPSFPVLREAIPPTQVNPTWAYGGCEKTCGCFGGEKSPVSKSAELQSLGCCNRTQEGITGLTGHSNQNFYTVTNLDYDPNEEVMISVRLKCGLVVRPLESVRKSNPVPEPVA